MQTITKSGWLIPRWSDPRIPFASLLTVYCILGVTVLGFNRSPFQIALTLGACCLLDFAFHWLFKNGRKIVPLSGYITGAGIALLLNYSHNSWLLFLPAFFAIASKYLITFEGRHVINPNLCGVMAALTLGQGLYASSPSYQWGGSGAIVVFIIMAALVLFVFKVGRSVLIISFIVFYFVQTAFRAWVMRWHIPPETLFYGALTSPAFFLFTFYMITDPKTSPSGRWAQVGWALGIALLDLVYHMMFSLSTFFYALFVISLGRWVWLHASQLFRTGLPGIKKLVDWNYAFRFSTLSGIGACGFLLYAFWIHPEFCTVSPGFKLVEVKQAENREKYPIPGTLNMVIAGLQMSCLLFLIWLSGRVPLGWELALISAAYAMIMNSAYSMLHEAEHNILHSNRSINNSTGIILALFFPAPFHLLRQGHLGHHMRNRSDDEAFDFYFEGENSIWKYMQLYGILTGFFWVSIVLSNFLALFIPNLLKPKFVSFDRPTAALLETLNPKFQTLVRLESLAVVTLHGFLMWIWAIPFSHYATVLGGFGLLWSTLQYVHHFGTVRDVQKGALNLRTFAWLDLLWLNHNWHLNHHLRPTVPWVYLPFLDSQILRGSLILAYIRMWRGPRFTTERVQNHYAGKIIG